MTRDPTCVSVAPGAAEISAVRAVVSVAFVVVFQKTDASARSAWVTNVATVDRYPIQTAATLTPQCGLRLMRKRLTA